MEKYLNFTYKISLFTILGCVICLSFSFSQELPQKFPPGIKNSEEAKAFFEQMRKTGPELKALSKTADSKPVVQPLTHIQNETSSKKDDEKNITLDVKNMDVIDVLKILADEGQLNLSIDGNVKGRITLFLKDINVNDALDIVLLSSSLACEKQGEILYILPERNYELKYGKKYWDKKDIRVFQLKHANASKVKNVLSQVISKIGKVVVDEATNTLVVMDVAQRLEQVAMIVRKVDVAMHTKVFNLNYLSAKDIEPKIKENLTKDSGKLRIDETTNKIIVTDYPNKIKEISDIIKAFDEKPLQVLINAQIIEIKPSQNFYSGIDWDYWIEKYFKVSGGFDSIPSTTTDGLAFGTVATQAVAGKGDYKGVMEFLQTFGETRIVSSPRIVVLNNQEAKILVGTKDVFITSSVSEVGESAVTTQEVNYEEVGVKLFVTPTINKAGYVTLKIKPEISSSERETITTDDKETQIPIVTTSEVETTVIVKDGVGIIIGGLRKVTRDKENKQIPILGSIPGLGALFGSKKDEWSKNELVILLTPRIVSGDKSIEVELREKKEAKREKVFDSLHHDEKNIDSYYFPDSSNEFNNENENNKNEVSKLIRPSKEDLVRNEYDYFSLVVEKIKKTAGNLDTDKTGQVRVVFSLDRYGNIYNSIDVVSLNIDFDSSVEQIARNIIIESAPFPPFPAFMLEEYKTFEVVLVL